MPNARPFRWAFRPHLTVVYRGTLKRSPGNRRPYGRVRAPPITRRKATMMAVKIEVVAFKSCPFCGSTSITTVDGDYAWCHGCHATGPQLREDDFDSDESVDVQIAALWNGRHVHSD